MRRRIYKYAEEDTKRYKAVRHHACRYGMRDSGIRRQPLMTKKMSVKLSLSLSLSLSLNAISPSHRETHTHTCVCVCACIHRQHKHTLADRE